MERGASETTNVVVHDYQVNQHEARINYNTTWSWSRLLRLLS